MKQIIDILLSVLPWVRKDPRREREFTELVKSQFDYLMEIIERFREDYVKIHLQLQEVYNEVSELRGSLAAVELIRS